MEIYYDIIIAGGGAAGLLAAAGAGSQRSGQTLKIAVLEKMPRPGRKIMLTGKGRCNFTNVKPWEEFQQHIHPAPNLLKSAFFNLNPERLTAMLNAAGLETVLERGDRAFPASHRAADAVDTLAKIAHEAGAEILCNKEITSFSRQEGGQAAFSLQCADGSSYCCAKLIVTTGGLSYPTSGSTGDGLRWAKQLGLDVRPTFPSLTAIVPEGYKVSEEESPQKQQRPADSEELRGHIDRSCPLSAKGELLCGMQLKNVNVSAWIDGNEVCEEFGDIDFTDGGLEGPVGFKISRRCVNALRNGSRVLVMIDLKPAVEMAALEKRIESLWKEILADRRSARLDDKGKLRVVAGKLLPREFVRGFLSCNPQVVSRAGGRAVAGALAKALKQWQMDIAGYVGYERCVITAGGVSASELSPRTLECKKIPGLYFAGEVLDLDADTGGYNLQIAFSTGYLAGESAARSFQ